MPCGKSMVAGRWRLSRWGICRSDWGLCRPFGADPAEARAGLRLRLTKIVPFLIGYAVG